MRDAESWTFESGKEGVWIRQSSRDWDSGRRTDGWEKAALVQRLSQAQMPVRASFGSAAGAKDVDFGPCVRPLKLCFSFQLPAPKQAQEMPPHSASRRPSKYQLLYVSTFFF